MVYTSLDNPKIKELKSLHLKKYRDTHNLFLVEGEHLVIEAIKRGVLKEVVVTDDSSYDFDVPLIKVSSKVMKYLSELTTPSNVIGVCYKLEEKEIGDKVLILEDIQDPGNLGTIIRSAVAFNIDTIILSNSTVDFYNSKVIRSTQGMMFHINIINDDLLKIVFELKEKGYKIYGTDVNGGKSIKNVVKNDKFAIIVGNEGRGMSFDLKKMCDSFIYIDVNPVVESLNVGVAASIILYELDK